jgi:hypothetical protein
MASKSFAVHWNRNHKLAKVYMSDVLWISEILCCNIFQQSTAIVAWLFVVLLLLFSHVEAAQAFKYREYVFRVENKTFDRSRNQMAFRVVRTSRMAGTENLWSIKVESIRS